MATYVQTTTTENKRDKNWKRNRQVHWIRREDITGPVLWKNKRKTKWKRKRRKREEPIKSPCSSRFKTETTHDPDKIFKLQGWWNNSQWEGRRCKTQEKETVQKKLWHSHEFLQITEEYVTARTHQSSGLAQAFWNKQQPNSGFTGLNQERPF